MTGEGPEYQYHMKDHLGNVRLTFTSKVDVDTSIADFETGSADFLYYTEAVKINSEVFDHTDAGPTQYSARLNGTQKERYGLAKSLKVMPGDKVNAKVFAKYLDPDTTWINDMPSFMASIASGTAPSGTFVDGGFAGSLRYARCCS